MALARVKTWTSEVLTSADLNAEFNSILNNAISLISPLTANLAVGGNDITGIDELELSSGGDASAAGRLRRSTKALTWHDGAAARVVPMVMDRSVVFSSVVSTTVETTVYSFIVPANTIITNRTLRLSLTANYTNNAGGTPSLTVKTKFGATTLCTFLYSTIPSSAIGRNLILHLNVTSGNSTSAQYCAQRCTLSGNGQAVGTDMGTAGDQLFVSTAAEDTTAAKTLSVTVTHSSANAAIEAVVYAILTELL